MALAKGPKVFGHSLDNTGGPGHYSGEPAEAKQAVSVGHTSNKSA